MHRSTSFCGTGRTSWRPLTLTAADSGATGDPVSYEAAPGATPVLSGGIPVTGWARVSGSSGLWSAPVPARTISRQLYADGRPA